MVSQANAFPLSLTDNTHWVTNMPIPRHTVRCCINPCSRLLQTLPDVCFVKASRTTDRCANTTLNGL